MGKANRILKSFLAVLMAAMMFFSIPADAYAYIGAIIPNSAGQTHGTMKSGNETYAYIQNEFIHFDICIATKDGSKLTTYTGSHAHTIPMAMYNKDKLDDFGVQNISIMKAPMLSYNEKTDEYTVGDYSKMTVTRVDPRFDVDDRFPMYDGDDNPATYHGDLALDYWILNENNNYVVHTYFNLVKLNEGSHTAADMDDVSADDGDTSVNWGVSCTTYVESKLVYRTITEKDGKNPTTSYNNANNAFFRVEMEYVDFAKTGHESIKQNQLKDIAVNAETISESGLLSQTVVSNGVSKTSPNTVTEVYCDSYSTAAPFVACSYNYFYSMAGGVQGHDGYYPESIEYANNTLKTYTPGCYSFVQKYVTIVHDQKTERLDKYSNEFTNLWGYRNLVVQEEIQQQQIQPDKFDVAGTAQYLCVFPNGTLNGTQLYTVKPAANADAIKSLEGEYGKSIAQYRGEYVIETNNDGSVKYYKFNAGVVALSPSITATWNVVNSYFRLLPNGTLEFEQGKVALNTPTFKFYDPKDGGGLTFDGYDSKLGVKFGIKPDKNNAAINISLPGNSVQVKGASIDTAGNLVFTGKFKMNLFVAQMEMLKLGYGLNADSEFVCNGVHAKGKLKVPKAPGKDKDDDEEAKPNVLGFGGAKMEGEVNTFPGEELYDFKFELTIKNLFSTKAELTLVRLKNGSLCPEHLYFELKAEAEGAGIDLTPGTPVVTITGGGGGIDGLASTIDGNYTCIPPVVLTLVTYGQVIKVVDGKLTAKIGPSILKLSGEDLGFKVGDSNLEIVDSMYAGIYLTGKEITYGNAAKSIPTKTYRGVTFGGSLGIGVKIFNFKDDSDPLAKTLKFFNNTISASASLGLETYAGGATDGTNWMYMYIGTYGNASCSLNIPAGVPAIGGKALLGAALDFKLGAQTAFETGNGANSAKQFFKNASLTGGIAATGYVWPVYGRIIYVIPDKVKFQGKLFKELDELNWDDYLVEGGGGQGSNISTLALTEPEVVETEDGEQAIAYAAANVAPVNTRVLSRGTAKGGTVTKTVLTSTANIADGEKLVFAVVPKNAEDIDALESSITCDKLDELNWVPDVIPATDTDPGYNAWRSTFAADEDGNVEKEAIYLSLTKEQATAGESKTTITASVDFDVKGLATTPVTGLDAGITSDVLEATIENPENGKNYALYTYFGTKTIDENGEEQITTEYAVDGRSIENAAGVQAVTLNASGNVAPTGDYYVTTALVEKTTVTVVKDDNGTPDDPSDDITEDIDAEIPVATWVSPSTYHYVNTTVPTAPSDVTLELIGNESMKGSWKKADNADGYKVTIYQQDGNNWVDTERGYNLKNEDFASTQGLAYDEATQTYSIEMAMTVGGDGEASTITSADGDAVNISSAAAKEIAALEAGKTYKIGVQAYKSNDIVIDGETSSYDEYSSEAESNDLLLPVYKPVTFTVEVGGKTIAPDENGIYNATVNNNGYAIAVSGAKDGDTDVSADTVFTVSRTNLTDDEGNDYSVPLNQLSENEFSLPDFDGTLALEISAKYDHDNVTDETLGYVYVTKDNVAPVISFEKDSYNADGNGAYTVKGTTEPGATVVINSKSIIADDNGAFKYSSNLGKNLTKLVTAYAKDDLGNESEAVSTIVSAKYDLTKATVTGITDLPYTGSAITQNFTVSLGGEVITDYTVAYKNNVNVGKATLTITGTGFYKGTVTKTFNITKRNVSTATVSGLTAKTYTGKALTPGFTVTIAGRTLVKNTDYTVAYSNNINAGTATVVITGKGYYTGTKTVKFTISAKAISPTVTLSKTSFTYNGKAQKPTVTVMNGKAKLKNGTDYTVSYAKGRKKVGTYKVTVTMKGNYSGKETASFKIKKAKNPIKLKAKTVTVDSSKLKKAKVAIKLDKYLKVTSAQGKVTYKKSGGNKAVSVNKKTGKITIRKKGLKKGKAYQIKIKVKAAGNANYKAKTKTVTVKIKVK
jgi:hypothetical protein